MSNPERSLDCDVALEFPSGSAEGNREERTMRESAGWTALMWAAAEGHQAVVEVLLRHGADAGAADQDGERAIRT